MLILSKRRNIVVGLFCIPPDLVKSTEPHRTEIAIFSRSICTGRISSLGGSTKSGIDLRGRPSCQWPTVCEVFHNSTQLVFLFISITPVIMVQLKNKLHILVQHQIYNTVLPTKKNFRLPTFTQKQ